MPNPQTKGKGGEREIAKIFIERMQRIENIVGGNKHSENVKRCSSVQADSGGSDLLGVPELSIEVKRSEQLNVDKWWEQCSAQARPNEMPVLFYRQNRKTWRVRWYMCSCSPHKWIVAEISAKQFFDWFDQWYQEFLMREKQR